MYTTSTRNAATLCPDAAIFVSLIQQTTKYWLKTEAVLDATLVTSGGGSLLKKVAARGGQGNSTARALAAVQTTCSLLQPDTPGVTTRDSELENEHKKCRTTLLRWDSEDSCADRDEAPGDIVMQEPDRIRSTSGPFYANGALSYWAECRYEYPLLHLVPYCKTRQGLTHTLRWVHRGHPLHRSEIAPLLGQSPARNGRRCCPSTWRCNAWCVPMRSSFHRTFTSLRTCRKPRALELVRTGSPCSLNLCPAI